MVHGERQWMREDQVGLYDFSSSWFDPGQWIEEAILDQELSTLCFYFLTCHRLAGRGYCFKENKKMRTWSGD